MYLVIFPILYVFFLIQPPYRPLCVLRDLSQTSSSIRYVILYIISAVDMVYIIVSLTFIFIS